MRLSFDLLQPRSALPQPRPLHWAPLPAGLGVRHGAEPTSAAGAVGSLEEAHQRADQLRAQAHAEAESVLAAAAERAVALAAEAEALARARGLRRGRAQARAEAEALLAEAGRIRQEAERDRLAALDALVADVAGLAADVARQVLQREIEQSPEDIVRLTRQLLQRLEGPAIVRVHPTLSTVLEADAGGLGRAVEVRADPSVTPGGVVVESEEGVLDATVEGRWARVTGAIRGDVPHGA